MNEQTIKRCLRCNKIAIWERLSGRNEEFGWKWLMPPPCFRPKPTVTVVNETCPACDEGAPTK